MTNVEESLVFSLHDLYMILVDMNNNLINLQRKKNLFITNFPIYLLGLEPHTSEVGSECFTSATPWPQT